METERELRVSTALRLAAQSESVRRELPLRSLLLGVEAIEATRRHNEPVHPVARQTLNAALSVIGGLPLLDHDVAINSTFSADRKTLVTERGSEVRLWDLTHPWSNRIVLRTTQGHDVTAISSDRRWILTKGRVNEEVNELQLWDLNSNDPRKDLGRYDTYRIWPHRFSLDNRWLAVAIDNTVRVWDLTAHEIGKPLHTFDAHEGEQHTWCLGFCPNSRWLASGAHDGKVRVWDVTADNPAQAGFTFHLGQKEPWARSLAFSTDGRRLAVGASTDGPSSVRLWDLSAEDPAASPLILPGHRTAIEALTFSPDGRWLVSGGSEVIRWHLTSSRSAETSTLLRGHEGAVVTASISPDSAWLVTGSEDRTARLWKLSADDPSSTSVVLRGQERQLGMDFQAVAFTADSQWVITRSYDWRTRIIACPVSHCPLRPCGSTLPEGECNSV